MGEKNRERERGERELRRDKHTAWTLMLMAVRLPTNRGLERCRGFEKDYSIIINVFQMSSCLSSLAYDSVS